MDFSISYPYECVVAWYQKLVKTLVKILLANWLESWRKYGRIVHSYAKKDAEVLIDRLWIHDDVYMTDAYYTNIPQHNNPPTDTGVYCLGILCWLTTNILAELILGSIKNYYESTLTNAFFQWE